MIFHTCLVHANREIFLLITCLINIKYLFFKVNTDQVMSIRRVLSNDIRSLWNITIGAILEFIFQPTVTVHFEEISQFEMASTIVRAL